MNLDEDLRCTSCGSSLRFASERNGAYKCLACGTITEGCGPEMADRGDLQVLVRTYRAKSPDRAASDMEDDAARLAEAGYMPVSQSWAGGQWGCGAYVLGVLLILLFGIGLLVLLYLLVVKPDGTLTVTYQLQPAPATTPAPATKVCPDCAETVQAAARICRFCRHEFETAEG